MRYKLEFKKSALKGMAKTRCDFKAATEKQTDRTPGTTTLTEREVKWCKKPIQNKTQAIRL